jgi:hypothetical protein
MTPIKVKIGPTPKITHFDFNIFLILIADLISLIVLNNFIGSILYALEIMTKVSFQASPPPMGSEFPEMI